MPPPRANSLRFPRSRRVVGGMFLVLVAALAVRIWGFGDESFWLDEVYSARIVEGPLGAILDRIPPDKPPLDYYLQALFHPVAVPEISHRLPALIASLFVFFGVGVWAARSFGPRAAAAAFAIAAFSAMVLHYAREARPYSLLMALTAWQQATFATWWEAALRGDESARGERPQRQRRWTALATLAVLNLALLFTMYSALIVFGVQLALLVASPWIPLRSGGGGRVAGARWFRLLRDYAAALALALVPAALLLWRRAELHVSDEYYWRFEGFHWLQVSYWAAHPLLIVIAPGGAVAVAIVSLLLMGLGMRAAWKRNPPACLLLGGTSVIPLFALPFLYAYIDRQYFVRYAVFCIPGLCIVYALGLRSLTSRVGETLGFSGANRVRWTRHAAFALVAGVCLASIVHTAMRRPTRPDWAGAAAKIAGAYRPGELIVASGNAMRICLQYYMERHFGDSVEVLGQDRFAQSPEPREGVWMVFERHGPSARRGELFAVGVERQGRALPDDATIAAYARQYGPAPTLPMADLPSDLIGEGWSLPERWSEDTSVRWIVGHRGALFLPLTTATHGRLAVALFPHSYDGAPPQTVTLHVNDHRFDSREALPWTPTVLVWDVPVEAVRVGANAIVIECANVRSPSEFKRNYGDFRALAAAVEFVRWEPVE